MAPSENGSWDDEYDVVIAGSGGAALAAAITAADDGATVALFEAAEQIGGTTAISGGMPWVPCNRHMAGAGEEDSRADALDYLDSLIQGREPDRERLEFFVDHGHEAITYLEEHTPLSLRVCRSFADYHADRQGGRRRGRSLDSAPFPACESLGDWDSRIRRSPHFPSATLDEIAGATSSANPKDSGSIVAGTAEVGSSLSEIIAERDAQGIRTCGGAMVAALLRGLLDRGVEPRTSHRVTRLLTDAGEVVGAEIDNGADPIRVRARRGVVLACGGFDWNRELVRTFIGVPDIWPLSPPSVRGDGLIMGMEAGSALANMTVTWAVPVISDGFSTYDGAPMHFMNNPRQEPGVIFVNSRGERFVNEAVGYMQLPLSFRVFDTTELCWPNERAWLIFDSRVRERVVLGDFVPGQPTPGWFVEAASIGELAERIGLPTAALVASVERWNAQVAKGDDDDFGRGTVWFEGWTSGGPDPDRMLAPVDQPPYFATRVYDGAIGTAGGLQTDHHGRVLALRGDVIPGLYAAGNTAASVFGPAYPGGGATLGQALAFGHFAGRHAATRHGAVPQ